MPSSRETSSNFLQTWNAKSSRLLVSLSGSGIGLNAEMLIKNLDFYNLELAGQSCTITIKLEHAELFVRETGHLEILMPSSDKIVLREAVN